MINYSIIIPHKNTPDLLQRCLNSIPRRDDIQIIVVDDNSDQTIVDFNKFPGVGEKCVEVYFTNEGKGAGYARNVGLKHAVGKWLLFADADDFYNAGFLNVLDTYVDNDFDVLFFNENSVYSDTLEPANRAKRINNYMNNYLKDKSKINEDAIRYRFWVPSNKMFSRKHIEKYNLSFEEIPKGNDLYFCLCASYLGSYKIDINKLYCISYYYSSITYNKKTMFWELNNLAKINSFMSYLGRKKWRITMTRYFISITFHFGVCMAFSLFIYYVRHKDDIEKGKNIIVNKLILANR